MDPDLSLPSAFFGVLETLYPRSHRGFEVKRSGIEPFVFLSTLSFEVPLTNIVTTVTWSWLSSYSEGPVEDENPRHDVVCHTSST